MSNKAKVLETKQVEALNPTSACFYFQVFDIFSSKSVQKKAMRYIERFFGYSVYKEKHLELSFKLLVELCASSDLNTTSEIEVIKACDSWIKHNTEERSKFAIELIKTFRLPLLSSAAKKTLILPDSSFSTCKKYIKSSPSFKNLLSTDAASVMLQTRYCAQENFDIAVCGGTIVTPYFRNLNVIHLLNSSNLSTTSTLTTSDYAKQASNAVFLNGNIYLIPVSPNLVSIPRKVLINSYSVCENKWNESITCNECSLTHNACAFMNKLYISGSCDYEDKQNIFSFDPKTYMFEKRAEMKELRQRSACSVFGDRIVISGGNWKNGRRLQRKSVEAYDAAKDRWVKMPDMREGRRGHSSAAIGNKLYVFGGTQRLTAEVFDIFSNRFSRIRADFPPFEGADYQITFDTITLGHKVYVFNQYDFTMAIFDTDKEEWSEIQELSLNGQTPNLRQFCCVKLPRQ